jgi:NADH-quinone oxidoreductase subunit H
LGGWASNSKYAVLGGVRASAQMISYELAMGLAVIPVIMLANSMDLGEVVAAQKGMWYIVLQPVAGFIFFVAILAELERSPFDLLEAEQELSSGYNVEYGGMRFGMFFMAEYMKMVIFCAILPPSSSAAIVVRLSTRYLCWESSIPALRSSYSCS